MKRITKFTCPAFAALALVCFAVLSTPNAFGVTPPPDGGYPGGNTAEGDNALLSLTDGVNNTAVGANALRDDTTGAYNVAIGEAALANNTTGFQNMAIGAEALRDNNANFNLAIGFRVLFMNTTGNHLTGIGAAALRNNTIANFNTAIGADALRENTTGEDNTAIGADALSSNTTGDDNTATGSQALSSNTTGFRNTANGVNALFSNKTGKGNTATGYQALYYNNGAAGYNGDYNTANGLQALFSNTNGHFNTGIGRYALRKNTTGSFNTAIGNDAMAFADGNCNFNTATGYAALRNSYGHGNTANGFEALSSNRSGSYNVAMGLYAGGNGQTGVTAGSNNTLVGYSAGANVTTADNVICFGSNVAGANVSNTTWIDGIYGVTTLSGTTAPVIVSADGQLGTVASSERFKKDIATMEKASDAILSLRPVTFHYKTDTKGTPQFGLIAEEVAKVNPALVLPDKEGKPYTVRYDAVNAMLLNEFLKEHRKNEEQQRTITDLKSTVAQQQKQIDALTAGLQKVSALVETSRTAPQVVNNP